MKTTVHGMLVMALMGALVLSLPAGALVIAPAPAGELNLHQIWNELYAPNAADPLHYTDSNDLWADWGINFQGGNDLFVSQNAGEFGMEAIYAANTQDFGWYDPSNLDKTWLVNVPGDKTLLSGNPSGPINATVSPFGFYLESGGETWFSQASLNTGGRRALAVLRTPGPTVGPANTAARHWDYLLAWDDTAGTDDDFNDLVVGVSGVRHVVPEPMTMTLLGIGLAGIATRRFLTKK